MKLHYDLVIEKNIYAKILYKMTGAKVKDTNNFVSLHKVYDTIEAERAYKIINQSQS